VTLHDIVHTDKSLTLVFEYLEKDLKQYMDDCGGILAMNNVKVRREEVLLSASRETIDWREISISRTLSSSFADIPFPTDPRIGLLPLQADSSQRSQAAKFAD